MRINNAIDIISKVEFLHFKFKIKDFSGRAEFTIKVHTRDTRDLSKDIDIFHVSYCDIEPMSEQELVDYLFNRVIGVLKHEVKELFKYKGQALYDEHLDSGQRQRITDALFKSHNL